MKLIATLFLLLFIMSCKNDVTTYKGELLSTNNDGSKLYLIKKGEDSLYYVDNNKSIRSERRSTENNGDDNDKMVTVQINGADIRIPPARLLTSIERDTHRHAHKRWHIIQVLGDENFSGTKYFFLKLEGDQAADANYVVCSETIKDELVGLASNPTPIPFYIHYYKSSEAASAFNYTGTMSDVFHPTVQILKWDKMIDGYNYSFGLVKSYTTNANHFHFNPIIHD